MERITIFNRTTKTEGEIRLRFRLVDGRKADMYHKSQIKASLAEIAKFSPDGTIKPGTRIFNRDLAEAIKEEIAIMSNAYRAMREKRLPLDSDTFETTIQAITSPSAQANMDLFDVRFETFIREGRRDGIFGTSRESAYEALLGIIRRFQIINCLHYIKVKDVDADMLMRLRQFIADEYIYVNDWRQLYVGMRVQNIPAMRRSQNTIAARLRMLQTFFTELEDREEIVKSPFRKLGKERKHAFMRERYDEPIYLKASELAIIMAAEIPASLEECRKAFILQCAFGCRISDFQALTMENISITDDGIPYIHYLPIKTSHSQANNAEIQTPIMRYALEIIKESKFHFAILRYATGKSGYNTKIRELLKCCGIERQCAEYNEETGQNEYKPLWEFGSSKLARKTHVDMMNKVQVNQYAAGLHMEGSKAVHHYTSMEIGDRFLLMCAAFNQKPYKVDRDLNVIE